MLMKEGAGKYYLHDRNGVKWRVVKTNQWNARWKLTAAGRNDSLPFSTLKGAAQHIEAAEKASTVDELDYYYAGEHLKPGIKVAMNDGLTYEIKAIKKVTYGYWSVIMLDLLYTPENTVGMPFRTKMQVTRLVEIV